MPCKFDFFFRKGNVHMKITRKGKRILSLLLAIVLLVTMLPSGVLPVSSQEVDSDKQHPDIGKLAKLTSFFAYAYKDLSNMGDAKVVGNTYYPQRVVITGVQAVGSVTYYQLSAAEGYEWPAVATAAELGDGFWLDSTKVIIINVCDKCGAEDCTKVHVFCPYCDKYDCTLEHNDPYQPYIAPMIPNNPTMTPGADVSLVDEDGQPVIDHLTVIEGTQYCMSAWLADENAKGDITYQWQICYNLANDQWVDINGENGKGILFSSAMFAGVANYRGESAIRCVARWNGGSYTSDAIAVKVQEPTTNISVVKFAAAQPSDTVAPIADEVQYSIVIEYRFRDDKQAANSWTANLSAGSDYVLDVESPTVVGYKPNQARITENIVNFSGNRVIIVYYDPDIVNFKVVHHKQDVAGGNYTAVQTDTKKGTTGTMVGADLQVELTGAFTGFKNLRYDESLIIAADGSTVVNIYYDREYYLLSLNLNGGYGPEPMYVRYGTPVTLATPRKTGYTFTGWTPALPTTVTQNTSHTANWQTANAKVNVVFWYENPNDDGYSYMDSAIVTAATGGAVSSVDYSGVSFKGRDDKHFVYNSAKAETKTVMGDGSTVINVYFSRKTYTLTFLQCKTEEHKHDTSCFKESMTQAGAYQDNLKDKYPDAKNGDMEKYSIYWYVYLDGTWYRRSSSYTNKPTWRCGGDGVAKAEHDHVGACYPSTSEQALAQKNNYTCKQYTFKWQQSVASYWEAGIGGRSAGTRWRAYNAYGENGNQLYGKYGVGIMIDMPDTNVTFYWLEDGKYECVMNYYVEPISGTGSIPLEGRTYNQLYHFTARMGAITENEEYLDLTGFTKVYTWDELISKGLTLEYANGDTPPTGNFYYSRNSYYLNFISNGATVNSVSYKYQAPVNPSSTYTPPYPEGLADGAYVFKGWYTSEDCKPGTEVNWSGTTMPVGGLTVYAKWEYISHTVRTYQNKGGSLLSKYTITHGTAMDANVEDPTNGSLEFVGWFYQIDGEERAYDFSMPVYRDMELYAKWTSDEMGYGTITYIDRDTGKILAEKTPIQGMLGATKTYDAKIGSELTYQGVTYTGYFPELPSHNIEFETDEFKNDFTFYYKAMEKVAYEVRYVNSVTGKPMPGVATKEGTTREPTLSFRAETIKGYSADAVEKTLVVSSDATLNIITFYYKEDTVHAPVQVVHYIQNSNGSGYTKYLTEQPYQGVIGQTQTANALTIAGFTYNSGKSTSSAMLTDVGLELEMYYDRNTYSYEFRFQDANGNKLAEPVKGTGLYGTLVEYTATSILGYRLTVGSETITITDNNAANIKTFVYEERTATIKYQLGAGGVGSLSKEMETILAVNGSASLGATATETDPNYKFVGWYTDFACTEANRVTANATVIPEKNGGVYIDVTYYAKFEEIKVNINYEVVMPEGATDAAMLDKYSEAVSIITGRPVGATVVNIPDGYRFVGWYSDAACTQIVSTSLSYAPPRTDDPWVNGATFYAKFVQLHTITWDYGYGTESEELVHGSIVTVPDGDPVRDGYTFLGWYVDAQFTEGYVFGGALTQDITLYAKWERSLTTLTIDVVYPADYSIDGDQAFLFQLTGENVDLTIAILEDGKAVIDGLTIGAQYTVKLDAAWSWRYSIKQGTDIQSSNVTAAAVTGNSVTFTLGEDGLLTFMVTRDTDQWLDGNDWHEPNFGN